MMTPELRRELENCLCGGGNSKSWQFTQSLAKMILAEHPADEDELWDGPWLLSVGFRQGNISLWWFSPDLQLEIGDKTAVISDVASNKAVIRKPTTRGDVRRLCAALKIQLKESGHE
jgi:hypothetical protein